MLLYLSDSHPLKGAPMRAPKKEMLLKVGLRKLRLHTRLNWKKIKQFVKEGLTYEEEKLTVGNSLLLGFYIAFMLSLKYSFLTLMQCFISFFMDWFFLGDNLS